MSNSGRTLRVTVLAVRYQEPRRCYLSISTGRIPEGNPSSSSNWAAWPEQAARTATWEPSRSADHARSSLLLRLPQPLSELPASQPLVRVGVFAAPSLDAASAASSSPAPGDRGEAAAAASSPPGGGPPDALLALGQVRCGDNEASRLLAGGRIRVTTELAAEAAGVPVDGGMGGAESPGSRLLPGLRRGQGGEVEMELVLLDAEPSGGQAEGGPGSSQLVDSLVEDCIAKQTAFGRLGGQMDSAVARLELMAWRMVEVEKRGRSAVEENAKLQQLLEQEKQSWRIPQLKVLANSTMLSKEELIARCESVMAAYGRERARNGELVERLKQLHAEQVDTLELKKRYQQLQEAHIEQARVLDDVDGEVGSPGGGGLLGRYMQLQATVKTQEEIIRNLEVLLKQAVEKAKPALLAQQHNHHPDQPQQGGGGAAPADAAEGLRGGPSDKPTEHGGVGDDAWGTPRQVTDGPQGGQQQQQPGMPGPDGWELDGTGRGTAQSGAGRSAETSDDASESLGAPPSSSATDSGTSSGGSGSDTSSGTDSSTSRGNPQSPDTDSAAPADAGAGAGGPCDADELEALATRLQGEVASLTEERTALVLRAEYAESAADTAREELTAVTKKYAREIADLKTRLAEKDAQMMGGFGELDTLPRGRGSEIPAPGAPGPWGGGAQNHGSPLPAGPGPAGGLPSPPGPYVSPGRTSPGAVSPVGPPGWEQPQPQPYASPPASQHPPPAFASPSPSASPGPGLGPGLGSVGTRGSPGPPADGISANGAGVANLPPLPPSSADSLKPPRVRNRLPQPPRPSSVPVDADDAAHHLPAKAASDGLPAAAGQVPGRVVRSSEEPYRTARRSNTTPPGSSEAARGPPMAAWGTTSADGALPPPQGPGDVAPSPTAAGPAALGARTSPARSSTGGSRPSSRLAGSGSPGPEASSSSPLLPPIRSPHGGGAAGP